jgi:hypothetical protein
MLRHNQNGGKKNLGLPCILCLTRHVGLQQLFAGTSWRPERNVPLVVFRSESYAALNAGNIKNRQVRSGVLRKANLSDSCATFSLPFLGSSSFLW